MTPERLVLVHLDHESLPPDLGDLQYVGALRYDGGSRSLLERMGTYVRPQRLSWKDFGSSIGQSAMPEKAVSSLPSAREALVNLTAFVGDDLPVATTNAQETCAIIRRDAHFHGLSYRRTQWLDLPSLEKQVFNRRVSIPQMAQAFGLIPREPEESHTGFSPERYLEIAGEVTLRLLDLLPRRQSPLLWLQLGGLPAAPLDAALAAAA